MVSTHPVLVQIYMPHLLMIHTTGASAFGGISYNGGNLSLENNHIVTEGSSAYGVVVYSNPSTLLPTQTVISNSSITTSGAAGQINGDTQKFKQIKAGWSKVDAYTLGVLERDFPKILKSQYPKNSLFLI
ncbi:MAG: hypothetical protein LEGION0403_FIIPPAGN_02188 [Legionella sp.]